MQAPLKVGIVHKYLAYQKCKIVKYLPLFEFIFQFDHLFVGGMLCLGYRLFQVFSLVLAKI